MFRVSFEGDENINKSSPTPSDQSTSSKENTFIGKARRVGLPKIKSNFKVFYFVLKYFCFVIFFYYSLL